MSSNAASAVLVQIARNLRVKQLDTLWRIEKDTYLGPCDRLRDLVAGQTVEIFDELVIHPDGSMTVRGPYGWDGPSPRLKVLWHGRVLFTIGTPLGPRIKGTKLRATARGTLRHDCLCGNAKAIAAALSVPTTKIIDVADLCLRDDISEDWSPKWGKRFYKGVRIGADAYREAIHSTERTEHHG